MNKEKRPTDVPNRDPEFDSAEFTYNDTLKLPSSLKTFLTSKGLDWRFLNATQFRAAGNYHRSHWKPFIIKDYPELVGTLSTSIEGMIQRGDLILGIRTKAISAKHREFLAERNRRYNNFAKDEAKKLRDDARKKGLDVKIHEGYDEDEKGFK